MLAALASAGHGSKIIITDAHYPVATAVRQGAPIVRLALIAGEPTVSFIAQRIVAAIPVESAELPRVPDEHLPAEVHAELLDILGHTPINWVSRSELYEVGRSEDIALCLVSGDTRRFGNLILTVGVLHND
ncbi:MAG: RbsD or FucU transport [Actinomycetota bacterium]|nr:RbsD or FucU transport [Actinomycetota bacterium]